MGGKGDGEIGSDWKKYVFAYFLCSCSMQNFKFLADKGHNSVNSFWNSAKSHLSIDPKQYSEFQDLSSSNSLEIVLTRFSYCYESKV